MTFRPNRKQALLLWKLLTAETDDDRSPMQSKARPELGPAERAELVRHGFLELSKQKRGTRLVLTDKAWAWASTDTQVELLRSSSTVGVVALEGLLHRLIPFLQAQGIALAEVITEPKSALSATQAATPPAQPVAPLPVPLSVETELAGVCREMNAQRPNGELRLTELRRRLPHISREALDTELHRLHTLGKVALYRDDNSAAVTADDERAALLVGGEPRHLLYWKD